MALCGAVAGLLALLAASGVAAADEPGQPEATELFDAGNYSQALRAAEQAVERWPGSPSAHHERGVILRRVFRREEAAVEFERTLALAPHYADATIELGWVAAELGDVERARALAAAAADELPEQAAELQAWVDRELRARGGRPPFAPGSASAFVAVVMDKLVEGEFRQVLRDHIDRSLLDGWAAQAGLSEASDQFLAELAVHLDKVLAERALGTRLRSHEVAAESAERDGRTVVTVTLLLEFSASPDVLRRFERVAADRSARVVVDATVAAVLRGLEPTDRKATLAALAAHPVSSQFVLEVELAGGPRTWTITDFVFPDEARRLSDVRMVPAKKPIKEALEAGESVGRVLGLLFVAGLLIAIARFLFRRKTS